MLQGSDNKRRYVTLCILKRIILHLCVDRSDLSNRLIDLRKRQLIHHAFHSCYFYWHNYTSMCIFFVLYAFHYTFREPLRRKIGRTFQYTRSEK